MSFNITPVASGYQEIHPYSVMNIDSVKINTFLIMMKYWSISAFVKTGYNDRYRCQMSTRGGEYSLWWPLYFVEPLQRFAPDSPSSIRPHHSTSDLQSRKGRPREQEKKPEKVVAWTEKYAWRTLWGNNQQKPPDMLNTPCMSFSSLKIDTGLTKKQRSQKCCSLLQLLKTGGFRKTFQLYLLTLCTLHSNYLYLKILGEVILHQNLSCKYSHI